MCQMHSCLLVCADQHTVEELSHNVHYISHCSGGIELVNLKDML